MIKFPFPTLLLLHALCGATESKEALPSSPDCASSKFKSPIIPGTTILSITAEERRNISASSPIATVPGLDICDIKVTLTHPGANDTVLVQTWLPLNTEDWNGRFQATGGGGHATGLFDFWLGPAVKAGYSASSTDGGHQLDLGDISWALNPDRSVNWPLLQNFATRSLADMVLVGKSLTHQYFGRLPHHSYWDGCSQGGRQGFAIAQRYPDLLDGIYAYAPAIKYVDIAMGDFWAQIVMREEEYLMSQCEFQYFTDKAIEECDMLDGVRDGIIEDPAICKFRPESLVGQKATCDGADVKITKKMATIVRKVHEGPSTRFGHHFWHGLPYGAPTRGIANITIHGDGVRSQNPFIVSQSWIQNLLLKDPSFNTSKLTLSDYFALSAYNTERYSWLLNSDNPNLTPFRDAGGKILTWHGTNDELIPYQSSIQYREHVEAEMGGAKEVNDFYRLFLAPGVEHCGRGVGPVPIDPLARLVEWVENSEPPEKLDAETTNKEGERITRELCMWPKKSVYMGIGDGKRASSWSCEGGYDDDEEEQLEGSEEFLSGLMDKLSGLGAQMGLKVS